MTRRRFWTAMAAILLLASFFRFYRLADHPLGLFFDPAINGLDAIRLMERGGHLLFFPTNGGRESLFIYLLIPFIWLFDTTPFSLRALTASFSLLTVAGLVGWLRHRPIRGATPGLALLAGLTLATSYWAMAVSRLGQRPVMVPFLAVLIFWFFLVGWHSDRRRWFALAGLAMGLAGYTYSAARLLPLILGLALLPELPWLLKKPVDRRRLLNLLLFGLMAALVYAPMAWYLWSHPAQFTARAGSVMVWHFLDTPAEIGAELVRNLGRVAAFFCCAGSPNPIFGPPGFPGLPLSLTPFLLLGLAFALRQWRDFFWRLAGLWWLVGISPSILAIEAPHPLRMIVALPPTAILVGQGLWLAAAWLRSRLPAPMAYLLLLLLLLLPLPTMVDAYFREWTAREETQGVYDYGAVAIRETVLAQPTDSQPLYLPADRLNDSTLLFYLSGSFQREARLTVPIQARARLLAPESTFETASWVRLYQGRATILPPLTEAGQRLIQETLHSPAARPVRTITGETAAWLAPVAPDPAQFVEAPAQPIAAKFGPLRLTGASYPITLQPPDSFPVTLFWEAASPTPHEYEILLRLVDDQRRARGNDDARPTDWLYPTSFWRPGPDQVAARQTVTMLSPLPEPGRYWLAVSVFEPGQERLLPLTAGTNDAPDTFYVGPLKVPLSPPKPELVQRIASPPVTFGTVARLVGYTAEPASLTPSQSLELTLLWETLATPPVDYTVFVHLLDSAGTMPAGHDSQPLGGRYPTTIWSSGEQILDHHLLPLPAELPPGQYRLAIGLYHQPTGQRLPLRLPDGSVEPEGRLILDKLLTIGKE